MRPFSQIMTFRIKHNFIDGLVGDDFVDILKVIIVVKNS